MTGPIKEPLSHLTAKQRQRTGRILKQILDRREATRRELADSLGMSTSSIAKYVKTLSEAGFVRETAEGENSHSRRSPALELEPGVGLNVTLILELGAIHGALVSPRGDIVERVSEPVFYGIEACELVSRLRSVAGRLVERVGGLGKRLFGIAIGMGGAVDQRYGICYDYRYARNWGVVSVKEIMEEQFHVPCFVLHDTNAVVAGEKHYGFGVGVDSFLTVWIADGVSLGAAINGEVYLGQDGFLGEFGHIRAVEAGPLCYCGHRGCLETVTKERYILEKAAAGLRDGVHSEIQALSGDPEKITIEDLKTAANHGDRFCKAIFEEVAEHLGGKLSDIINVFNPGLVTFRGSVIDANEFLFENIYRIIMNRSVRNTSNSIRLKYAAADEQIRLRGLGSWILTNYFVGQWNGPTHAE